jgi:phenylacetate-CoA ligase
MPNFARILYNLAAAKRRLYWNEDRLRGYQERKLRSVIEYAYNFVPYYHEKFKEAGVTPRDIRTLEDLSKLPIARKNEMKFENPRNLVSVEFDITRLKAISTSGSTGQPFTTYLCDSEDDWRKAIYMRANISCGQRLRDHWVVITSPHHFKDTTNIQRRLGFYAQTCISLFASVDEQIKSVTEAEPDVLDGYSGSLLSLAREVDRKGLDTIQPRIVFGTADLIDDASVKFMERVFGAPFYDQFGCAEIDRSAWQCPEKIGYHMDVDSVITQFVDDEGQEVSAGKRGEVVYTSLFSYAMPFIRYAVGDVGTPSDEECPCGITFPLMKVVEGRKDSLILLPDGRVLSPMAVRNAISEYFDLIVQYRVVQKKLDFLEIYVEKKDSSVDEKSLGSKLVEHINRTFDLEKCGVSVAVNFVEKVPLSKTGKLAAVVSELAN